MMLFKKLREIARAVTDKSLVELFLKSDDVSGRIRIQGMDAPAENFLWIYLGMTARAESVSQVPMRLSDSADNIIESGPLVDLLNRPNSVMDGVQYLHLVECYLALHGECFVAKVGEGAFPDELIPLDPARCSPIQAVHTPTGVRMLAGVAYRDNTTARHHSFLLEDVIPILSFNPHNPVRALSAMTPGKRTLQGEMAMREQNLALFLNGGMPDVVFETDRPMTKEQADELLQRWQDRYGGYRNAHKPGVLHSGLKAHGIGLNPTELEFLNGLRLSRQEQIALMRVKPAMVGLMEGETGLSQGTSTSEQKTAWWSETGLYELARIAAAHQVHLVDAYSWPAGRTVREAMRAERDAQQRQRKRIRRVSTSSRRGSMYLWFDENQIEELVEHRLAKMDTAEKLLARGWRPDDVSDYLDLNLPPHPTNQGTLPFNLQAVGDVAPTQAAALPPAPGASRSAALAAVDRIEATFETRMEIARAGEETLRKRLDGVLAPLVKQAAAKYSRFFLEQRKRVLERFDERDAVRADEEGKPDITQEDMLKSMFRMEDENGHLMVRIGALFGEHVLAGVETVVEETGETIDLSLEDPRVMQAIERRKIQATKINETTQDDLRRILAAGFADGDTVAQLADRIDAYYREQCIGPNKARPLTAARTQTTGLVNDGRMLAAREVGGLKKAWLHGGSREPRDAHLAAASRYAQAPIGLDEQFEINGYACDAPGSTELPVREVANCTCMVSFVKG